MIESSEESTIGTVVGVANTNLKAGQFITDRDIVTSGTAHIVRPKVSVFTPLSEAGNPFIEETYESLKAQTLDDWEWIVLTNNGGELPAHILADRRVFLYNDTESQGVGALKSVAARLCHGEWIAELDHDDVLAPYALRAVWNHNNKADFVYSDFAEFHTGSVAPNPYLAEYGWRAYAVEFRGAHLLAMRAPENPIEWRRILWAPNHLRAWRRETYLKVGGHDSSLRFADDQDLVLRTYLSGARCERIPECLYFYRVHDRQNVKTSNAEIQSLAEGVYQKHIYALAEKVSEEGRMHNVDLCGAHGCPPNYVPIDRFPVPGRVVEDFSEDAGDVLFRAYKQFSDAPGVRMGSCVVADLDQRWPLATSSVGVLRAFDAIEHLKDKIHTMNEAWRVLAPGGVMLIRVPSTDTMTERDGDGKIVKVVPGSGAYCDPTHVSFWNALSFRYYTDDAFRKYVPEIKARFLVSGLRSYVADGIPYVAAELIAIKDGHRLMGKSLC